MITKYESFNYPKPSFAYPQSISDHHCSLFSLARPMPKFEEKDWLQHLYSQAPVAISIYVGERHVIELANPKMCEIWGRSLDDVLHQPLFQALPEVSGQGFEEILAEVLHTGKPFTGSELPATLHRNGRLDLAYINIVYEPLRNEKQEIYGIIQTATEVTELVGARKKAEYNEEILKVALEAGNMGTWHVDFINRQLSRSSGSNLILGYDNPDGALDVETFFNCVIPEDRPIAEKNYQESLKNGRLDYEVRIRWPDESLHWIHIKGEAYFNLKGNPISMSGIILDITEKKQIEVKQKELVAEQAARQEAERQGQVLQDLFMQAPALICTYRGPNHVFELVNPLYQQLFSGKTLVGRSLVDAVPEIKGQEAFKILNEVYKTGKSFTGKEIKVLLDRSGTGELSVVYFDVVYQPRRDVYGNIMGILVFAYNVTDQILARQHLESNEGSLRLALEAGHMGTWNFDLINGSFVRSLQHDQIFGYANGTENWSFDHLTHHVLPADRRAVAEKFELALKTGELSFEARILLADQAERCIAVKGQVFFENKNPVRLAGVVMDITHRKNTEHQLHVLTQELASSNEELSAANEMIQERLEEVSKINTELTKINDDLDNFIYTASHDLKAPIANIEGLLNTLASVFAADDLNEQRPLLNKLFNYMEVSVERFKKTIGELTEIAEVQKDIQDIAVVNTLDIIHEVRLDMETLIQQEGAEIILNIQDCQPFEFPPKNLKSIVYNLLSNALKYRSPERKPVVHISCYQEDEQQVIEVQDNGLGIKQSGQEKIFMMFKRLHAHVEGSGVGLYLVKRIIDNAGGKLELESKEGEGSIFKVFLPLSGNNNR